MAFKLLKQGGGRIHMAHTVDMVAKVKIKVNLMPADHGR
jgi:hypothetical protein